MIDRFVFQIFWLSYFWITNIWYTQTKHDTHMIHKDRDITHAIHTDRSTTHEIQADGDTTHVTHSVVTPHTSPSWRFNMVLNDLYQTWCFQNQTFPHSYLAGEQLWHPQSWQVWRLRHRQTPRGWDAPGSALTCQRWTGTKGAALCTDHPRSGTDGGAEGWRTAGDQRINWRNLSSDHMTF